MIELTIEVQQLIGLAGLLSGFLIWFPILYNI